MAKEITRGPVEFVALYDLPNQDSFRSCHVKQKVSTAYVNRRGPFVKNESATYDSDRYAFVAVPLDWDEERCTKEVAAGSVQRTLGCIPQSVMNEGQREWMRSLSAVEAQAFMENWQQRNIVINGETGEEVTYKDYECYGQNAFVLGTHNDIDLREKDIALLAAMETDVANSPLIKKEIAVEDLVEETA